MLPSKIGLTGTNVVAAMSSALRRKRQSLVVGIEIDIRMGGGDLPILGLLLLLANGRTICTMPSMYCSPTKS
jgi:hypothetical protein